MRKTLNFVLMLVVAVLTYSFHVQTACCAPTCIYGYSVNVPNGVGGCCIIEVDYCYEIIGGILTMSVNKVTFPDPSCAVIMGPGMMHWLSKKIIASPPISVLLNIKVCPELTAMIVITDISSCWHQISIIGGTGGVVFNPCGETRCIRRCSVCLTTAETDPCSTPPNAPILFFAGCQNTIEVCVPNHSTECIINICDSN